jgi:RHS repeat-associated protein
MSRSKRVISGLVFISFLLQAILPFGYSYDAGNVYAQSETKGKSFTVPPGRASKLEYEGAELDIPAGSVSQDTTITIIPLEEEEMPLLDAGMDNATQGPWRGYRLLPHNMKFNKPITIKLPYDPALIPEGLSENDLKTFFFNDQTGTWQELDIVKIDTRKNIIESISDHFTDFINATVTVPDHPQVLSFAPTTLKDIQAADPTTGINLIEAPQANNTGDARLAYPIELPQGRQGMQPHLSLNYNSAGGNSWLGLGWDVNFPAVTVDTRWGVPRYDDDQETETYLLEGEMLTPVAHRGELQPRTPDKVFQARAERQFRRIIRHGDHPANYWWEVVEKNGTRLLFGGDWDTGALAPDSVLTDESGRIFKWMLREARDRNGNGVRYSYDKVTDLAIDGGTIEGSQIYPLTINYTQFNGADGRYIVTFVRHTTRRPDVIIDGRGGFLQVTAQLLKEIKIELDGTPIRSYELTYTLGAFDKTLLEKVSQYGADGTLFNTHELSYYDEVRDDAGAYQGFGASESWNTISDGVQSDVVQRVANVAGEDWGKASALGASINTGGGGHLYVGYNATLPLKQGSVGGKVGYTYTGSEGVLALVDLNGDDLPDKVFKDNGGVAFRLNQSGPAGTTIFGEKISVNLPALSKESAHTVSFGLEAYPFVNLFTNYAHTFNLGSVYLSDVNGDGLPDLVQNGQVLYNHLNANGIPTFTASSADTPVPIGDGAVDTNGIVPDYEALYQQNIDTFPLHDTVRRWIAPFAGTVRITAPVSLTGVAPDDHPADGVRVAIQHNGSELWAETIAYDDTDPHTPTGVDALSVSAGDRIYFRLQSVEDGAYDQVAWDPEIVYVDGEGNPLTAGDVNLLDAYRYKTSEDFVLAGRRGIHTQMPLNGTVHLAGDLSKLAVTTDDVTLQVIRNALSPSPEVVFSHTLAWDEVGSIPLSLDIEVVQDDTLTLVAAVDSNIDLRQIVWVPDLYYVALDPPDPTQVLIDGDGNPLFRLHPPYDIDFYPDNSLADPQQPSWTADMDRTITVTTQLMASFDAAPGQVTFTIKRPGELLGKSFVEVLEGGAVTNTSVTVDVNQGDVLYFDYSVRDPELKNKLQNTDVLVQYEDQLFERPAMLHSATYTGLFAQPYRGWAVVGYNGNRERATQPMDETVLPILPSAYADDYFDQDNGDAALNEECSDENFTSEGDFLSSGCSPAAARAYVFYPEPAANLWRGQADQAWAAADSMSSSRLGADSVAVPREGDFGGRAVTRLSHTSQVAIGAGVILLSGSASVGDSYGTIEFLDMNGDRFPDVVGDGRIQYTDMTGGLEISNRVIDGLGKPLSSDNFAWNFGMGGNGAFFESDSTGAVDTPGKGQPQGANTGSQMATLGFSESLGQGNSDIRYALRDMNADGLPDLVARGNGGLLVALNLGYRFAPAELWGDAAINEGSSTSISAGISLGFNGGIYDFGGGGSLSKNDSSIDESLLDVNGDGLLDRVRPGTSSDHLRVALNTGSGFAPEIDWYGGLSRQISRSGNAGLGQGAYFTIGIGPLCWPTPLCYIIINPGADVSIDMARQELALMDVDGDGNPDHVFSSDDGSLTVARNTTGRTNLLKSVQRPLGATIDLEYERDGNTYDLPQSRWVLSRVSVFDGLVGDGVDTRLTTYRYQGGYYDRLEREFYGYGRVIEETRDASDGDALYRTITSDYLNDSFYTKGLLKRILVADAAGNPFVETENTYFLRDVSTGLALANPQSTTATAFAEFRRTKDHHFEGAVPAAKSTFTEFAYDALGNLTRNFEAGDEGPDDDVLAEAEYTTCTNTYVVGIPWRIIVKDAAGSVLRHRQADVDCATGNITQIREYLDDTTYAATDLFYHDNGTLKEIVAPPNLNGEHYRMTYKFDPVVETYIIETRDIYGYVSTAAFDYRFGKMTEGVDLNNNRISYTYDTFGRLTTLVGPYEQGGNLPTLRFTYHHDAVVPWALTQHLDPYRDQSGADTIDTATFSDGTKRVVQIKKDATLHVGPDDPPQEAMTVSGWSVVDLVGRTVRQHYPSDEPAGTPGVLNTVPDPVTPTLKEYDILDRETRIVEPDGSITRYQYGFGQDRDGVTRFLTTMTDALGNQEKSYRDTRNVLTAIERFLDGQSVWTSYVFDPMRDLILIVDDQGNQMHIEYDRLGRRTAVDSPDAGRTEMVYDLASNLTAKITANLRAEGKQISYSYEFNRLISISYPNFPENDVNYTYGAPGAPQNGAGRIILVTDQSGSEQRFYGKLGEVVRETKTVAADTGPKGQVYTTSYEYDSFGRLQQITYPDGEVLTYDYDSGGMLRKAVGEKLGFTYPYINRIEYDKFEEQVFVETGNGVRSSYTYRPDNRLLENLQTGLTGASPFQNLTYTHDEVGNIISLANDVAAPPPPIYGGPTLQTYTYDDLYRLTAATGRYQYMPDKSRHYTLDLVYDSIDNLTYKAQADWIAQPSGTQVPQHKTSYMWTYEYDGPQPHAPTHIDNRTFSYDANGNQLGWQHDQNGTRRTIVWDEENRVQSIFDNGHEKKYKYNDTGERVIKRGPQGETVYVNEFYVIRNGTIGTKHIYAGGTRLVSKLVQKNVFEKDQYYQHGDHLGSTNFVTDLNGKLYEHLEYMPYGETWVQEASNTQRTPYLFTGKELDEETGLYYYGARYYDPRVSQFMSPEPLLEQDPEKVLERPQLLSAYSYAASNPVRYLDPDGFDIIIAYGSAKNKKMAATFKKGAELLAGQIKAIDPNVRVKLVDIGKVVTVKAAGGKKVKLTPAQLLARAAGEITAANRKVSALAIVSHGNHEGAVLPRSGQFLDFGDAVKQAQVEKGGAAVAMACRVGEGVKKDIFRKNDIGLYATSEYFWWETVNKNRGGLTAIRPDQKRANDSLYTRIKPGDIVLPNLTAPVNVNADILAKDPNIAKVLVDADKRITTKK